MSHRNLIRAFQGACIAAVALTASATTAPAEEAASIANPAIANRSVASPPTVSPPGVSTPASADNSPPQTAPPATGRPPRRGAGSRNSVPSYTNLPPATFRLPADYSVLNTRSIFSRTGQAAAASTGPTRPEESLAVRGIVSDERMFFVFIEDTASHRIMQLRPGDTVAGGKVGRICIDDFTFETPAASKHIRVGQNLAGASLPPVTPATPQPPAPDQPKPNGAPNNTNPRKEPVFEIGPNGQRVRNLVAERAG